jgi:hypothetical protein
MSSEVELTTLVNKDGSTYPYKGVLGSGAAFTATPCVREGAPDSYLIKVEDNNGSDAVLVEVEVMEDERALDEVIAKMIEKRQELESKRREAQAKVIKSVRYNYGQRGWATTPGK